MTGRRKQAVRSHRWVSCEQWLRDNPGEELPIDETETRWRQQHLFVEVES